MKFSTILEKDLRRSSYSSNPAGGFLPAPLLKIKLPSKYFSRNPSTSQEHLLFQETPSSVIFWKYSHYQNISTLPWYLFLFFGYLFSQDLTTPIIRAHMAVTHFSVPYFDEFFKQFKCFWRLNINRNRILNFALKRGKTFCAKFVMIWSGHTKIILVLRSLWP